MNTKKIEWVLRIAIAGEFIGHGLLAVGGKKDWIPWIQHFISVSPETALSIIFWIGVFDIFVALMILFKPIRVLLLWAVFWGFWTALVRWIVGVGYLDFIERWANWGAPLALLLILGIPKNLKGWFSSKD